MKITIITVVYNNPMIREALDSVLNQRLDAGDELELIVVDGGSTDGTLDVLEAYRPRLGGLLSEPDHGIYDAMNKGIKLATGNIIGMLNSDDLYRDGEVLASVVKAFRSGKIEVVYGDLVYVQKDDPTQIVRYWQSEPYHSSLFEQGWAPPHPTFFVRRDVYEQFGYFDLNYKIAADFELMLRFMKRQKVTWAYIPEILVRMRMGGHSNQSIKNIIRGNRECYDAFKVNKIPISRFYFIKRMFRRISQYFGRISASRLLDGNGN